MMAQGTGVGSLMVLDTSAWLEVPGLESVVLKALPRTKKRWTAGTGMIDRQHSPWHADT